MDKEDCIHVLLSTLQKPRWKRSSSITDWDLKNVLWTAGFLPTPEQAAALLSDMKRRCLISGRETRGDNRIVAMWGIRIAPAGEEWLVQRVLGAAADGGRPTFSSHSTDTHGVDSIEDSANAPPRSVEMELQAG